MLDRMLGRKVAGEFVKTYDTERKKNGRDDNNLWTA